MLILLAGTPLKLTPVRPVKLLPVIVTNVPVGPLPGANELIKGGAPAWIVIVLSMLVEARLPTPDVIPVAAPAGMLAITVPDPVTPEIARSYVLGPPVRVTVLAPGAVPATVTAAPLNPITTSLNTAVK